MRLILICIVCFWLIIPGYVNFTCANSSPPSHTFFSHYPDLNFQSVPDTIVDIKKIGLEILNGLPVSQVNEDYIYQLIDSIMVNDSIERSFFFKVYNKIFEQATGYIYLEIGFSIKKFLYHFPDDFFTLPDSRVKEYADEIGELFRTEEEFPMEAAQKYADVLEEKCSPKNLEKAKKFNEEMLKAVEKK